MENYILDEAFVPYAKPTMEELSERKELEAGLDVTVGLASCNDAVRHITRT